MASTEAALIHSIYHPINKMEALLEKIVQNTEPKSSLQLIVSNNKTRFKTRFNPPIQLDKTINSMRLLSSISKLIIPFQISMLLIIILGTHPMTAILGSECVYQKEVMTSQISMIRYSKR